MSEGAENINGIENPVALEEALKNLNPAEKQLIEKIITNSKDVLSKHPNISGLHLIGSVLTDLNPNDIDILVTQKPNPEQPVGMRDDETLAEKNFYGVIVPFVNDLARTCSLECSETMPPFKRERDASNLASEGSVIVTSKDTSGRPIEFIRSFPSNNVNEIFSKGKPHLILVENSVNEDLSLTA